MTLAAAPTFPDWISAGASVVAALGAVGAFALAFILIRKQYSALDATTKALNDEMEWRHQERERQREEAQERRAEQARLVRLEPFTWKRNDRERSLAGGGVTAHGGTVHEIKAHFEVVNDSDARITNVKVGVEHEPGPRCYVTDFEEYAGANPAPVLPPGQSARFYWSHTISELATYVDFTDANGIRWRLHHRDDLSEMTGQE